MQVALGASKFAQAYLIVEGIRIEERAEDYSFSRLKKLSPGVREQSFFQKERN